MTLVTQVVTLIIGLVVSIILARVLGPTRKGILTLALVPPALAGSLINLGIDSATTYNVAKRTRPLPVLIGTGAGLMFAVGTVGAAVLAVLILLAPDLVTPGVRTLYAVVALAFLPMSLTWNLLDGVPLGLQDYRLYNVMRIVGAAGVGITTVVAVWPLRGGVLGALIAQAVTFTALTVLALSFFRRRYGGVAFAWDTHYMKDALRYGWQINLGNAVAFLNYRVDVLLLGHFVTAAQIGLYSISFAVAEKLWLLSLAAGVVLFPRVASGRSEQDDPRFTALVTRTVALLTAAGGVVLLFVAPAVVGILFSSRYAGAVGPLRALLLGIVAFSAARILANDIAARGRPMLNVYASVGGVVVNVVLNLVWIPRYGIVGSAWASSVSYTAIFVARLFIFSWLTDTPAISVLRPRRSDLAHYRDTARRVVSRGDRAVSDTGADIWTRTPTE
jgi:O-antigen/teichoic acid export membrane protein